MRHSSVESGIRLLLGILAVLKWIPLPIQCVVVNPTAHIAYLSSVAIIPRNKHKSQNVVVFHDLLEDTSHEYPPFEFTSTQYPRYPYYDAPRNLFFDTTELVKESEQEEPEDEKKCSNTQEVYMRNAEKRRYNEDIDAWDDSPIAEFDRAIGKDYRDYVYVEGSRHPEEMTTDVAEYDAVKPGIAAWPSYEELKRDKIALNTSLVEEMDPSNPLQKQLITKPMWRNEIRTVGEARTEQKRWLKRSYYEEWPLTCKEFSELPLDLREAYYANRYPVCDEEERFKMVLNYRRSIGKAGDKMHPMEFRYMEDSYTYTPKESPVLHDLKNWDDPLEAPWRIRVEEAIRDCVSYGWPPQDIRVHTCFEVYDITWLAGVIKIVIEQTRDEGGPITHKELKLMLSKLEKRLQTLDEEEHTESISNHMLLLMSLPNNRSDEDKKRLFCRREWNDNIGKEVIVTFTDGARSTMSGIMRGSHSTLALDLDVDGKRHRLPLNFIREVQLL
ncbi:hypothetical protein BgAZ_300460 [Babesia gibsoni]|uniref:Uncharacterized protein n=1 Tax=Babesia gibsoni TaxID=33632 RepID=A0AAD8LJE0_BABGI|nr:hypothetical protein BgAZ_300460 [Babesia gibsoni]